MPGSLPITGVTVGETFDAGNSSIANVSPSLVPSGFDGLRMGARYLVYRAGANGAGVVFSFTQAYTNPSPYAQFHFDTNRAVSAGRELFTQFGLTNLRNAAKAAYPSGFDYLKFGIHRFRRNADIAFAFTDAYSAVTSLNTPFYFGGQLTASAFTVGDTFAAGYIEKVTKPPQLFPDSIGDTLLVGVKMRVGRYPDTNFFFTQAYTNPSPYAQFHFSTNRPLSAGNYIATQFGVTDVTNDASAAYPPGFDSFYNIGPNLRVHHRVPGGSAANVDFSFVFTDDPQNPLNVAFYFEGQLNPRPPGILSLQMGTPRIVVIHIEPSGWESLAFGGGNVWIRLKAIVNAWQMQDAYGTPADIDYEIRYRYFASIDSLGIGTAFVWMDPWYVTLPTADTSTFYGTPLVGYPQPLGASGFESLEFGENPAIDFRRLKPSAIVSLEISDNTSVKLSKRYITMQAQLDSLGMTPATIYNHDTYVYPDSFNDPATLAPGPVSYYGDGWQIRGPSGPVTPDPIERLRFGYFAVRLDDQAVFMQGVAGLEFSPNDVSHRVRYLAVPGYTHFSEPFIWTVWNKAAGISPSGFDTFAIGPDIPDIRDARQDWDYRSQGLTHTQYGVPMVAYRYRTVYVGAFRDRWIPEIDPPFVWTNKIVVNGFEAGDLGGTWFIHEQRNILKPTSWLFTLYGNAHIANRNRAYTMQGWDHLSFGDHSIRDNKIFPQGRTWTEFSEGPWWIADKTQRVTTWPPWLSLNIPWPYVRHDPIPPETQFARPSGFDIYWTQFGMPSVWIGNLYPEPIEELHFGQTTVRSNSIYPQGWFSSVDNFPDHAVVFTRYIKPPSFKLSDNPDNPSLQGTPHMWPHYIHAPHPIYNFDYYTPEYAKWGTPAVTNRHRSIYHTHTVYDTISHAFGEHEITLFRRQVYPSGFLRFRYGMPEMMGGIRTWATRVGITQTEFGTAKVAPPYIEVWSPYLNPSGISSFEDGDTEIQLKNRQLLVNGVETFASTTMPGPVHSPRYFPWTGYDATEWGEGTFIDFRIRHKNIEGFESFTCRPTPNKQMRVSRSPAGTAPVHALR